MEESKRKLIMIVIIVVCLALAGAITYITNTERSSGTKRAEMTWLKCRNPDCEHEYQMDLEDYYTSIKEHKLFMMKDAPALVCPNCGEESAYRAEKCEKCGLVFERMSVPDDFADKCPECGYSATEELEKSR